MAGWKKAAMVLGMGMSLISMPSAGAKEPPTLPDTPEEVAEFMLKRDRSGPVDEITDLIDSVIKKRFSCLRSNASGNRNRGWTLYNDIAPMALDMGGPDAYREIGGRYVIGFSCRAHSCDEKGLTIFDKAHNDFIFSIIHYFPWDKPGNDPDNWVSNGMISVFILPSYPEANLDALTTIVHAWAKQEHRGLRGEIVDIPPIHFYAVDCSDEPGSAGRQ